MFQSGAPNPLNIQPKNDPLSNRNSFSVCWKTSKNETGPRKKYPGNIIYLSDNVH